MDIRLKRLRYRSWHRGCKETDIILGHFADDGLARLAAPMIDLYEKLLDEDDADIWQWLIHENSSPPHYQPLIDLLKIHKTP